MFDIILVGGIIYDGQGGDAKRKDIAIKDDRIAAIGDFKNHSSLKRINVNGLIVSPGFIDMHSHSDVFCLVHPHAESKIRQGVTTEVIGNCGNSAAPIYGSLKAKRKQELERLGVKEIWSSFREYVSLVRDKGIAVNLIPLIGHGNLRGSVKGFSKSKLTKKERNRIQRLLNREMENGARGLSTGLIYIPSMYGSTKELVELIQHVTRYNGIYTTHIRGEGDSVISAIEEAVEIASATGVNCQISHLKTSGSRNWNKISRVFGIIEDGIKNGLNISCDRYPYIASNTDLDVLMPDWFNGMSPRRRMHFLSYRRKEIMGELTNSLEDGWQERVWIGGLNSGDNKWMEGLSIGKIAKKKRAAALDVLLNILKEERFDAQAIFFNMCEENLVRILKKPYVMIGSDSSLRTLEGNLRIGHPHPRTFGTFPRVLARYTGPGKLSLGEAIRKMTRLPAEKLGLKDRGVIKSRAYADLVVFDPKEIKDRSTFEEPFQYPSGIEYVIVNGEVVLEDGRPTGRLPGKVL